MALNLLDLIGETQSQQGGGQQAPTSVDPISVVVPNKPKDIGKKDTPDNSGDFSRSIYNNIPDIQMAKQGQALSNPSGGMKGTLRDVLGLIGDAMLVHAGKNPVYATAVQDRKVANAMTGFASDPRAAAARLAAVPGASTEAMKLYDQNNVQELKKQQEDANTSYRNTIISDREQANADSAKARRDNQAQRMIPYAGAILNDPNIKTPEDYAKAHAKVDKMFKRIGPDYSPADAGAVDPEDWTPDIQKNLGRTASQVGRTDVSEDSIQERRDSANQRDSTARRGQDMVSGKPTTTTIMDRLLDKQNNGGTLTPAEQQIWDAQVKGKPGNKPRLNIPGLTLPASGGNKPTGQMVIRGGKLVPK